MSKFVDPFTDTGFKIIFGKENKKYEHYADDAVYLTPRHIRTPGKCQQCRNPFSR